MAKHKHSGLIKQWADGAIIQFLSHDNQWKDCLNNNPTWRDAETYRVKIPQWQQELIDHIKQGGEVEYAFHGTRWEKAEALHWHVEQATSDYDWAPQACYRKKLKKWQQDLINKVKLGKIIEYKDNAGVWRDAKSLMHNVMYGSLENYNWKQEYRVKLEPWQQDLINYIKLGKVVEVKGKTWQPADDLVRSLMTNKTYEWKSKDCYRKKPESRFVYAYEAQDGHYYMSSRLLTTTEATEFFAKLKIENYQQLQTI